MGFSIFIFLWLFFAARINGDDFLKERLMSDFDPDVAPYLRKVSGKDVAILTTFNDFQIDIKPSAMDSLSFLYVNEKLDTPIHGMLMDLRCDKQCVIIFEINNGKKIYCQIGKDIAACHCPVNKLTRFSFTTNNYVPNGYLVSEANLTYLLEKVVHPCAPYEYVVKEKEKQKVIRASVKCYDVSHTYVDFEKEYPWQDSQPPDKCILGIFSTIDSQPFISVEPKKSLLKENETNILLYSIADLQKVPNSMITFKKPGWPRLPFQRKKTNQRFTLIKPENIQNFPGFIFDYDDFHCNNAKFSIRFFDREDCILHFHTTIDKFKYTTITAGKFGDKSDFYLKTNLTNWIMYYNSPNIRFSDKSLDEFYNSTDFYLCKQEIGERFVFEIIENEVSTLCTNFGLVTGPEVIVEVPKLIETIATSTISSNENNASNQKASENYTTTSSSEDTNQASVDPLIIAILTVVLLIFISVTNFFLIRRKWFKESRATTLTLDAFESHWQYIIPPSESNNNINE